MSLNLNLHDIIVHTITSGYVIEFSNFGTTLEINLSKKKYQIIIFKNTS